MKQIITMCLFLAFVLSGCKDETATSFLDGPWVVSPKGNITLYTRPTAYSGKDSPDASAISQTLDNQITFIEMINQKLDVQFNSGVSIYFYNHALPTVLGKRAKQ